MKSTFNTYDPRSQQELAQQALGVWTGQAPVPVPGADYSDPIAAQDAALAAQAQADLQYAQSPGVDPATVSSMPDPNAEPMSAPPGAQMTPQQQLASEALRAWSGASTPAEQPAPQQPAPAPVAREAAPAQQAPRGPQAPRRPTLLDEQNVMASATRDEAEQAKVDAGISTDKLATLTEVSGEEKATAAQRAAELYQQQQTELEEAGRAANEERRIRTAVADDISRQYKQLSDEAAATQIADRRTTGQRVMGALALALSGIGDAFTVEGGGQAQALDRTLGVINEAVDRDLAIQRANLDNKRNSAAAKFSELGIARNAIKDVDAQEAAARAALFEKYAVGLDAVKAQGMGEQATTTAAIAAEQIRQQAAQLNAQMAEQSATKESDRQFQLRVQDERDRKAAAAAANRGRAPMVAELLAKEQQGTIDVNELATLNKLRAGKLDVAKAEQELGASGGQAAPKGREVKDPALAAQATKEQRAKFSETQNVTVALESKIDQLLKLREKHGFKVGVPQTDAYKEAQTLNREIMLGLKKKQELGTLDNQSERFLNEMTGDPNAWLINTPETQLTAIKRGARDDLESQAQSLGYSSAFDQKEAYAAELGARDR